MKQELLQNRFSDELLKEFNSKLTNLNRTKQVVNFTFFHDPVQDIHKAIIFYYD